MTDTLDSTLGAAFLGMLASTILYGVTIVQTFMFFHDYRSQNSDGLFLKSVVFLLLLLDSAQLGLTIQGLYHYLVSNFGNFTVLEGPTTGVIAQIFVTNVSDLIVRMFFAGRVFVLCREDKILGISLASTIVLLSLLTFTFGCGLAARSFILKTFTRLHSISWMLYSSFGIAVLADILIAGSLCTFLLKNRTGFKRTDGVVNFLMAFTINSGLLTSLCAIACFVTYTIWPDRFIYIGIYFTLGKLYTNSLLASLNARSSLRVYNNNTMSMPTDISGPMTFPMKHLGSVLASKENITSDENGPA